jgi:hypothetical protein
MAWQDWLITLGLLPIILWIALGPMPVILLIA